ncbi:hypothetical protein [Pseudoxanthomonas beigongshangi]|uniref:hypothetical protein n=1 Tax=Pseudoxanthomonas beigongshangi TaxID=2782537 RepID=UPI00193B4522|nr:hypothetical protein [Pseudoxanthomonas beigongshangi]
MTNNRTAGAAGQMQAGEPFADASNDLLTLLDFHAVADGVKVGDLLRERLGSAQTAVASHAASERAAILAGEEAQQRHEAEAARLNRQVDRLALAIQTADERLALVAAEERRAEGEAAAVRAVKAAVAMEKQVAEYVGAARTVATLLEKIEAAAAELIRDRDLARSAGVECAAQLPDERRFRPERSEERQVVDRHGGPTVTDATGRSLDSKPVTYTETRRTERIITQQRHAPPSILTQRAVLPDPDGGNILDRNADAVRRHY